MKIIQRRILTLLVCCTFLVVLVVEFVGLGIMNRALKRDSVQIMKLMCAEQAGELNEYLHSVEQSVNTMHQVAMDGLVALEEQGVFLPENVVLNSIDENKLRTEEMQNYMAEVEAVARPLADNTEGAIAVYYRFDPELFTPTAGFFSVKLNNKEYEEMPTTDLSLYEKNDKEHVFWYYEPVNAGEAVWLNPYPNDNIGVEMISYVAPVFYDGYTIGVVGMDIDIASWREKVADITLYNSGFAVLTDGDGNVVYHPEYPEGVTTIEVPEVANINYYLQKSLQQEHNYDYELDAHEHAIVATKLDNDMTFGVIVPLREISQPSRLLMVETVLVAIGIVVLFSILSIRIFKRIMDVAYTDVMTGVKNKTAYEEEVEEISREIRGKTAEFALIMFDINNLKPTNDTYGHDQGDKLIIIAAAQMQKVFGKENVFRVGGDEFVVLLRHGEAASFQNRLQEFGQTLEQLNKEEAFVWGDIKVARGATLYDYRTDAAYADVFRRADALMYQNKKEQKGQE